MERIYWHTAFFEALKQELSVYGEELEFYNEFSLTMEPLKIDCVVVKKVKDLIITKNIGEIFRGINIFEYKNPGDYVSVRDYYKVYGYACLYASFRKNDIRDMTLSFVESRTPRAILKHLNIDRGYTVAEKHPGIYTVIRDVLKLTIKF